MDQTTAPGGRRFDLDWLRIIAILGIFVFHCGRFFDTFEWHIKNATTYEVVQIWSMFCALWGMPLVFFISGASLFYAIKPSRGALQFVDDKVRRLLIPFVVGIFTQIPLAVYFERVTHGQFSGSFWEFLPHYFDGWYGSGGNFAWTGLHLWYLEILFVFSLLTYPLLRWLKGNSGGQWLERLGKFLSAPGLVYLMALPIALVVVLLDPSTFLGARKWGGWSLTPFLIFLLYGFVIISNTRLQQRIQQARRISLLGGLALVGILLGILFSRGEPRYGSALYPLFYTLVVIGAWCWILTIVGFGFRYLNVPKPFLAYIGPAVLPFYILHQTVILSVGYFVVPLEIPDALKFLTILVLSFGSIMLLYEFVIRRNNVIRFLFGLKPLPRELRRREPKPAGI
jgi:surface polysaccharide O-acyltransferase-like enzyme